jgi:hypothetical protein
MNDIKYVKGSDLIESLSPEIAEKVLKNILLERGLSHLPNFLSFPFASYEQALKSAFKFADSIEGEEFWQNVVITNYTMPELHEIGSLFNDFCFDTDNF